MHIYSYNNRCFLFALLSLLFLIANQAIGETSVETHTMRVEMRGSNNFMKEQCVKFSAGDSVHYTFSSPHPLDFNVHYHTDTATEFPAKETNVTSFSGELLVQDAQEFCFMWTNKNRMDARWKFDLIYSVRTSGHAASDK